MRRVHLFELEDQTWLPQPVRDAGTDFLRFLTEVGNPYKPIIPRLQQALVATGSQEVLDLCSGGAGPAVTLQQQLVAAGCPVRVTLTDKFPNLAAFKYARARSAGSIAFIAEAIDATAVPPQLAGFRTLFASFHHFRPDQARRVLQDAVDQRRPIGIFEITERSLRGLLGPLILPVVVWIATPFIRPFRWSRLYWTYLIPVVPFFVMWDGLVSCVRTYSTQELQELVDGLQGADYVWAIDRVPGLTSPSVSYLIGYPTEPGE